jgi:type II secretory pathway pseudopilin PulG
VRRTWKRAPRERLPERGFSITELLVTFLILGLAVTVGSTVLRTMRPRVQIASAAKLLRMAVYQARMKAIFTGVSHFVAIDPIASRIDVFIDNGSTAGVLDSLDRRVGGSTISSIVKLSMPTDPSPLSNPLGGTALASAWPLPNPTGGSWAGRKGLFVTTTGLIETIETTPVVVNNAVIVFSDGRDRSSAVSIRGRMGQVRAFEQLDGNWKEQ